MFVSHMDSKSRRRFAGMRAKAAFKASLSSMSRNMVGQQCLRSTFVITKITLESFDSSMSLIVSVEAILAFKSLITEIAGEFLFIGVLAKFVTFDFSACLGTKITHITSMQFLCDVFLQDVRF